MESVRLKINNMTSAGATDGGSNDEIYGPEELRAILCTMQGILASISDQFHQQYINSKNQEDLNSMIDHVYWVVQLGPDKIPNWERLGAMGEFYSQRFSKLGNLQDLARAIQCAKQAIGFAPDLHPQNSDNLAGLGTSYKQLHTHSNRLEDLENSIDCFERAVSMGSNDHPEQPARLNKLSDLYRSLHEYTGRLEHAEKMMICSQEAVKLAPEGHEDRDTGLYILGTSHQMMFEHLGRLEDLDKSIYYIELAMVLTPDTHVDKAVRLSGLGLSYRVLFEYLGRMEDMEKAMSCHKRALCMSSESDACRPDLLDSLATSYRTLFQRTKRLEDLREGIYYSEQMPPMAARDHPEKCRRSANLGSLYATLFNHSGDPQDFDNAVTLLTQAVLLMTDGHIHKPIILNSLGATYLAHSRKIGEATSLSQSINCLEQAVLLSPHDDPALATFLRNLGESYRLRFLGFGLLRDAQSSIASLQRAATLPTGAPHDKFDAARRWANVAEDSSSCPLQAYTQAMTLLPQIVWLGSSVQLRYERVVREVGDLVTQAATAAILRKRNDLALEWLEQGRSIVWSQMLQLRTPLDNLRAVHPRIAEELELVCTQLEHAFVHGLTSQAHMSKQSGLQVEAAIEHRRSTERRERLIESIRELSGFEDFLRPLRSSTLVDMVQGRLVVIINVHGPHSAALVVQPGSETIAHVHLPGFSEQKAQNARRHLASLLKAQGVRRGVKVDAGTRKVTFVSILSMLWYDVVQPVLAYLNITQPLPADSEDLPHITWCTTGDLSSLPLHAAGDYSSPSTVLDNLAISSYSPTLTALGRSISAPASFSGILAVGHESSVRHLSALPGTKAELDQVQLLAGDRPLTRLDEDKACADAVLHAMESHSWVHFACHGSQNPYDPIKSALHLHDKDLDLATIAQHPLKNQQLAILSACQTAAGDAALPDESVHLAAGLLMAGYPAVIATLWSIHDQDAPLVARKLYECLLEGGVPDSRKAAKALHRAVATLRETISAEQYARWMPYVHIGC
ncbi:hypothetical protein FRC07_008715 [Ceratobasidium sp. 392]|nr:hypothetical protein FRC07_008715 [Ceratobasidium sp. 392]